MDSFDIEICSNCGREIARSEQAYVFEGKIVCAGCDNALRSSPVAEPIDTPEPPAAPGPIITAEPQFEELNQSKPVEQEKAKPSPDTDKPVGFIIAGVVLCLLGIGLISIGLVSLAVMFLLGMPIFGILMACWCLTSGMLILISGIAAIVVAVISVRRSPH
jgi:hypothetical protein